jgi:hypothetical protein
MWYQLFSYWGFALWLVPVISPTLILFLNLLFSILFILKKYKTFFHPVVLFILVTHAVPALYARRGALDVSGSMIIFIIYLLSLRLQGTDARTVYTRVLKEPPGTLGEYLKTRGLI